jgi:hypothetical protein
MGHFPDLPVNQVLAVFSAREFQILPFLCFEFVFENRPYDATSLEQWRRLPFPKCPKTSSPRGFRL